MVAQEIYQNLVKLLGNFRDRFFGQIDHYFKKSFFLIDYVLEGNFGQKGNDFLNFYLPVIG